MGLLQNQFPLWAVWKLEWKACFQKKNVVFDVGSFGDPSLSFSAAEMVLMEEWQCCAVLRSCTIPGLWKRAMLCSGALSVVCSQSGVQQPLVWGCAGSRRSCSGGSPVRLFHQAPWSFALPAVLPVPRVVLDGSFMDLPVNLVFLHGLRGQWGKFWLSDTNMVSQLSLWPADGVERILLFGRQGNRFSSILDLELEQHIFSCAFFPLISC